MVFLFLLDAHLGGFLGQFTLGCLANGTYTGTDLSGRETFALWH